MKEYANACLLCPTLLHTLLMPKLQRKIVTIKYFLHVVLWGSNGGVREAWRYGRNEERKRIEEGGTKSKKTEENERNRKEEEKGEIRRQGERYEEGGDRCNEGEKIGVRAEGRGWGVAAEGERRLEVDGEGKVGEGEREQEESGEDNRS